MSASILFLVGTGIALLASLIVVVYIKDPLRAILTELCGTAKRADFWLAFSTVALAITPMIFATSYTPDPHGSMAIEVVSQLKWGLIGLLLALITVGAVISRFIPRPNKTPASHSQSGSAAA